MGPGRGGPRVEVVVFGGEAVIDRPRLSPSERTDALMTVLDDREEGIPERVAHAGEDAVDAKVRGGALGVSVIEPPAVEVEGVGGVTPDGGQYDPKKMLALNKLSADAFGAMLTRVGPSPHSPATGVPAGPGATPSPRQRDEINRQGAASGCHTCGPGVAPGSPRHRIGARHQPTFLARSARRQVSLPVSCCPGPTPTRWACTWPRSARG